MIAEEAAPDATLGVFVRGGGCSGFQYGFAFEAESNEDDAVVHDDGFEVLIDATRYGCVSSFSG